ncbi:MAG TPA: AAA family ATPase [Gemmatimonadaceae bacterium]|nr:AAA family ATPase [Gemmatimonadaceae bacterium]
MVRLRTLGQCVAEVGTSRLGPEAEILFAVLLCLAMEGGRRVGRGLLTSLIWPKVDEGLGAHRLRQACYRLRTLGADVRSDRSHVWLEMTGVDADFLRAQRAHDARAMEAVAAEAGGGFLPGYAPSFSAPFADWVERQRDVVNAAVRRVLLGAMDAKRARGEWGEVEALTARCLLVDPLNEEATLASAEAAALQGGKTQALTILDRYLREIGPDAREIRLLATLLRRRIAEMPHAERPEPVRDAPFVGRTEEMELLNRQLHLAHAAQGSAHLIWGEPGIGKTRLVTEFSRAASLGRVQIVRVGCQSHDERRPFSAFADLAPKLLLVPGALGCAPESMRLLRRLYEHDPNETLPSPDTREAAVLYASIRRSILDLVDAVAAEAAIVLVIEDVHWLDGVSWDVMQELVPWLATRRALLILTSREPAPDRRKGIADLAGLRRHHLGPLSDESSRALLRSLLSRAGNPPRPELADWCAANGGGNPYYLSELALHGLRSGCDRIPASLTALITERLTRLRPMAQRVLQACAILGKSSTMERLEAVLDERRVDVLDSLDELEMGGLIVADGARVLSRHDLLSQAALAQMAETSRRLVHRHAAALLEREVMGSQSAALKWECAEHWERAGDSDRALRLLRSCALHALEVGVPAEAAALLEKAAGLTRTPEERQEVLGELANALRLAGQWERVLPVLEAITQLRERGCPGAEWHDEHELLGFEARWRCGGNVLVLLDQLTTCVESTASTASHKVHAATLALMIADNLCDATRAQHVYATARPYADFYGVDSTSRLHLDLIYECGFGDYEQAAQIARRLVNESRGQASVATLVRHLHHAALAIRGAGAFEESMSLLSEAYALATKYALGSVACSLANTASWTDMLRWNLPEAEWWHAQSEDWLARIQDRSAASNVLVTGALLSFFRADYDRAEVLLSDSARAARDAFHTRFQMIRDALRTHIRIRRDSTPPEANEMEELLSLHRQTKLTPAHDLVLYSLCAAFAALDRPHDARQLLQEYVHNFRRERFPLLPPLREEFGDSLRL